MSQLLFACGIAAEFTDGKGSRAGPIVLGLIGGMFIAGAFPMDPIGTPRAQRSWHGCLHASAGFLIYAWPVACFILVRRFREDARWKPLTGCTLAAGALGTVLAVVLSFRLRLFFTRPELFHHGTAPWSGVIQRAHHVALLGWQLVMAVWLYHLARVPKTSVGECS
jgi:hypothetical protein